MTHPILYACRVRHMRSSGSSNKSRTCEKFEIVENVIDRI